MHATPLGLATAMTLEGLTITHAGRPRIVMGTHEAGGVGVAFLDPDEGPRVTIGTDDEDESGIAIPDARHTPKIAIDSGPQGSGIVRRARHSPRSPTRGRGRTRRRFDRSPSWGLREYPDPDPGSNRRTRGDAGDAR